MQCTDAWTTSFVQYRYGVTKGEGGYKRFEI
jgi:hypothetical protein